MSRDPIDIPYSKSHGANRRRYAMSPCDCLLCAKPMNSNLKTKKWVMLDAALGKIIDPDSDDAKSENNGGYFFIGPDCWRSNPQLRGYDDKMMLDVDL